MIRVFAGGLVALTVLLQYRIWLSADGVSEVHRLKLAVAQQNLVANATPFYKRKDVQIAAGVGLLGVAMLYWWKK